MSPSHNNGERGLVMEPMEAHNMLSRDLRPRGSRALEWMAYAGMLVLSLAVFYALVRRGSSDLSIHATWAAERDFGSPRTFFRQVGHPLWHTLVAAVMLTGLSANLSATLVTALIKVLELFLMRRFMGQHLRGRISENAITLAALACALATSLWMPVLNPNVYGGVGSPNTWHSPTQLFAAVWMLLCLPYAAHCYETFLRLIPSQGERAMLPWKKAAALGAMLAVSLLAKPTFIQVFFPAAGLFLLAGWARHPRNSRFFGQMILAALPALLVCGLQYLYYFGGGASTQGSMVLEISLAKLGKTLWINLLMQAFPLYVLAVCTRRRDFASPLLTLTLLFDGVGILEYLILGEGGYRAADGNFGWGMMGGALMLWVVMLTLFLRSFAKAREAGGRSKAKYMGGFGLLLWHLGSGIYYLIYLLTTGSSL